MASLGLALMRRMDDFVPDIRSEEEAFQPSVPIIWGFISLYLRLIHVHPAARLVVWELLGMGMRMIEG